jgi:hypothetical protein
VKEEGKQRGTGENAETAGLSVNKPTHFSFGIRRFGAGQHRRLFVPQESSGNLTFLQTLERPQAIMRVISPSL